MTYPVPEGFYTDLPCAQTDCVLELVAAGTTGNFAIPQTRDGKLALEFDSFREWGDVKCLRCERCFRYERRRAGKPEWIDPTEKRHAPFSVVRPSVSPDA